MERWKAEEFQDKTAFTSHQRFYCFVRELFSPKNALKTFHHVLDVALVTVKRSFNFKYLDDNIIL